MLAQALRYERRGVYPHAFASMWANPSNLRAMHLAPVRALYEALFRRAGRPLPG